MKRIKSEDVEKFIEENDFKSQWSYISIGLNRKLLPGRLNAYYPVDYTAFIKDCLDNFNLMSFDFRLDGIDLYVCVAFDNIADWKHFVVFCSEHNFEVCLYLVEEYYEI